MRAERSSRLRLVTGKKLPALAKARLTLGGEQVLDEQPGGQLALGAGLEDLEGGAVDGQGGLAIGGGEGQDGPLVFAAQVCEDGFLARDGGRGGGDEQGVALGELVFGDLVVAQPGAAAIQQVAQEAQVCFDLGCRKAVTVPAGGDNVSAKCLQPAEDGGVLGGDEPAAEAVIVRIGPGGGAGLGF